MMFVTNARFELLIKEEFDLPGVTIVLECPQRRVFAQ